jgi:MFS family permease
MRRLLPLVCAIVLIDIALYSALAPLLPRYADELGLSKTAAGFLFAAYAAGVLAGALPAGVAAARLGPKRAVLAGLALLAVASVAFGLAEGLWTLASARLLQGFGSALSWSGGLAWLVAETPRERRGEALGTALGAAIFGALIGPALGAAADVLSPELAFAGVSAAAALLFAWALRTPGATPERVQPGALRQAFAERSFAGGLYLIALPALLFGVLAVLVPLRLGDLGWSAAAIGVIFIIAATMEAFLAPVLGRLSDRRGRLPLVRAALVGSIVVSVALAWAGGSPLNVTLMLAAALAFGSFYAPALALISDGAERAGLAQGLAFGLMNACWAVGNAVGPAMGGFLAELAGDEVPFLLAAALCVATLAAAWPRRAGTTVAVSPPH